MLTTLIGGWLAPKVGQSRVVGEIVGRILRGLSVFGRIAPNISNSLFPKSSTAAFETLSTIGLILFLFLIGMELDHELFYRQRKKALLASGVSILRPFAPGRGAYASVAVTFRRSRGRQYSVRAVPRHRDEHNDLHAAGAHPGREGAARHGTWLNRDLLRRGGRPVCVAPAFAGAGIVD